MTKHMLTIFTLTLACNTKDTSDPAEDSGSETVDTEDSAVGNEDIEDTIDEAHNWQPGVNELTLDQVVEGEVVERSYFVHLPDNYDGSANTPLLFAFHGAGGTGDGFIGEFSLAVQNGDFVGVYPNGIENSWNIEREDSKADDMAFTESILSALSGVAGIDVNRPVAVGFSNGAALIHKISIEKELFVAIVPQVSHLLVSNQPDSDSARIPVMQFNGTDDDLCPYDGGVGILGYEFMPAEDSTAAWAAHNGCDATPTETAIDPHVKLEWENCDDGNRVIHYRLNGVGHGVPPDVDGGTNPRIIEFLLEARQ